jgi:hypothetical protein
LFHKKHFDLQLLPINFLQKYNSHHPYGWNDGPLSFSKGYQYLVSGGVYMHWKNIHLTLRPEYFRTASDQYETSPEWGQVTPSLNKLILGQSSLRIDLGPISIGAGTNNIWRGPGITSSLLMSNNAQGFQHIGLNTIKPLKTFLGIFEISIYGAKLTQNKNQGYENNFLKTNSLNSYTRYINMLTFTYSPIFIKNLYVGANRVFHQISRSTPSNNFMRDYIPVTLPLFRNVYQDNAEFIDQLLSGFIKFIFPKNNAELYFEYGFNDGKSNLRDLLLDNSHSTASIFGFRKFYQFNSSKKILISFEATRMSQTPSYLQRNANNWYLHGQISEGFTHENQILGNGSGLGNNMQIFEIKFVKNYFTNFGIIFQNIKQDPMRLKYDPINFGLDNFVWNDLNYGFKFDYKINKILFKGNFIFVNSNNYSWVKNKSATNLFFSLNSIYVW